jgi:tetratricopeptide (TPR) repeat protein
MAVKPTRSSTLEGPGSRPASPRARRWWLGTAIACGVILAGSLAAVVWMKSRPDDLPRAEAAYRRNELATALRVAKDQLARRPSDRHAAAVAARCLSRLGRPDQAEEFYRKAAPLDLEDLHIRAYALVLANRREPAIRAYREILDRRPDDVLALSRMAAVLISESRWAEILEAARRLIEIPDGAVIGHTLEGVVHHNTRDPELAVFAFDRVIALDPGLERMPLKPRSMFWIDYAYNLLLVGRWADARKYLRRALDDGDDAKVADLLGQSYYLEGALDEAERYWRLALDWDPDRSGTWWRIGKLELQRGRPAEALGPLRRAVSIQPNAVGTLYSLGLAYRLLGRADESRHYLGLAERLRKSPAGASSANQDGTLLDSGSAAH